jgi:hypothetical protein
MDAIQAHAKSIALQSLHHEFRHVLTLLILAAAFNCDGVPQLRDPKYLAQLNDNEEGLYRKLTAFGVLSAIATALVRNHEVFAVASTMSKDVVMMLELNDGFMPMNMFISPKDPHEPFSSHATYCRRVPTGQPLKVDLKVEDEGWWKLCIEKQL